MLQPGSNLNGRQVIWYTLQFEDGQTYTTQRLRTAKSGALPRRVSPRHRRERNPPSASLELQSYTGSILVVGVAVARVVNVPQEVSQQPSCVRILPREELACRNSVFAELAFRFEHSYIHSRVLRVDEVDEVDKGVTDGLVGSDNRSCKQVE